MGNLFQKVFGSWDQELEDKVEKSEVQLQYVDELKLSMSDADIQKLTWDWQAISADLTKTVQDTWKENMTYYIWGQRTPRTIYSKHDIKDNKIFTSIETVAPLITAKPAQPVCFNNQPTEESEAESMFLEKILLWHYDHLAMKPKLEKVYKHSQIWKLWAMQYWIKNKKIFTDYIIPARLILDPWATCAEDSEFLGKEFFMTWAEIIKKWADKEKEVVVDLDTRMWTRVKLIEWFTPKYVFTTYEGKARFVLDKKRNPHFNYADLTEWGEKKEWKDFDMEDIISKSTNNFFDRPKIPFEFYQVWNLGLQILDDTNTLEQSKSLQDAINRRKSQIDINADKSWNPIKRAKGMTQDEVDKIVNRVEAWDAIGLKSAQELDYLQGQSLPIFVQQDLEDSRASIDNIFGTQATLRWERGASETATWRQILRQWSEDRQATPWWAMEIMLEEIYKGWVQLIKVHYKEKQIVPFLWEQDTKEFLEFSTNDIADWVEVKVRAWSVVPDDKIQQRAEAMELWWAQAITLEKLYTRLGWDNPIEEAEKYVVQQAENQKTQQEILQQEEAMKWEQATNQAQFQELQNAIGGLT